MRILVVADVHANPAALAALPTDCDAVLALGDLVEYGPDPKAVLDWCRANVTAGVRGNHDHGCAQNVDVQGVSGFRYLTAATRPFTRKKLTPCDRRYLADLPTTLHTTVGGLRFLLVHASPRDPLDEYMPPDPAVWASRLKGVSADFVCVGHTHQQYSFQVNGITVLNPGSLGLPRDGDPRARFAVIEDGTVTLHQAAYDIPAVVRGVMATDLDPRAKRLLADVYREGRYVHPSAAPLAATA
jgi:putative phosphoesterase